MNTAHVTGVFTIAFPFYLPYLQTTFELITYCLSSSAFIFLTLISFLSNKDQASALKIAYIFKVLGLKVV